jgi:D-xylose transport system substrate-binding protein
MWWANSEGHEPRKMRETMKSVSHEYQKHLFWLSVPLLICLVLASCSGSGSTTGGGTYVTNGGKGCTKVGILLPETASSIRWETEDHPLLIQAIKAAIPGVHIDYNNAQGNSVTQLTQAENDLANGDCILIVGPHDSVAAAPIVAKAKALNVPVIAYDRLIQSKYLNYYVSFDNFAVGKLQAQYIANHYTEYEKDGTTNVVMISGSQTDTNALLYSLGSHSVLDPLFAHGVLKNINETFTPNWDNNTAQTEMEGDLTDQQNNIQVAYVANDGMANGVINALKAVHLNGKVLVTGQDATATGINYILAGDQTMTVYKPIIKEAQSTGAVVKAIYQGTSVSSLTHGMTTATYDGGSIPSVFDTPISVDKTNIASTVIADHFLTKDQVCTAIPTGTDGVC